MKRSIYLTFLIVVLASCTQSSSPNSSQAFLPGTYEGMFMRLSVTDTMSGTVVFNFTDSSYDYKGHILNVSGILTNNDSSRDDRGSSRSRTSSAIEMSDISNIMGIKWRHSFYLGGPHNYTFDGSAMHIWQDTLGVAIDFQLKKK